MKFVIEPCQRYDERGTCREGWRLLVTSKVSGMKSVENSVFQNLSLLARHLNARCEVYEEVNRYESKAELGKKTPNVITQGTLRFKDQ